MRWLSFIFLFFFLTTSCSTFQGPIQTAANFGPSQTSSTETPNIFKSSNHAQESDMRDVETKSDKTGVILISVLSGLLVVAGIVIPLVLIK